MSEHSIRLRGFSRKSSTSLRNGCRGCTSMTRRTRQSASNSSPKDKNAALTEAAADLRPGIRGVFHGQTGCLPLGVSVFEPQGFEASPTQLRHRLIREDTVGPTAVGHDFLIAGQFP